VEQKLVQELSKENKDLKKNGKNKEMDIFQQKISEKTSKMEIEINQLRNQIILLENELRETQKQNFFSLNEKTKEIENLHQRIAEKTEKN